MKKKVSSFLCSKVQLSWASFVMLLLIVTLSLFSALLHRKEIIQLKQNEKALNDKVEELIKENSGLKIGRWTQFLHQPKLSSPEIQDLKKKGLKNPVNDIIADLLKHNELIPYQGVLGGKMGFHSEKDIYVVSTRLVRASFDDGHIGGWMLLEYQVAGRNKISWKVLESYLD
ncbi:MAG: hypothetical protein ABII89_08915 [Candidatus Omnitrophota bacterium]